MPTDAPLNVTAFLGTRRLASGPLPEVAAAARSVLDRAPAGPEGAVLVFDDGTGRVVDLDLRGTDEEVAVRAEAFAEALAEAGPGTGPLTPGPRGPGRPRLGVVAKEVTLLPRHWAWLAAQRGGASATLRRLVDEARRAGAAQERVRRAQDAAYRFASAMAGDRPGYEEAMRALFGGDRGAFASQIEAWPDDVRRHVLALAADAFGDAPSHG